MKDKMTKNSCAELGTPMDIYEIALADEQEQIKDGQDKGLILGYIVLLFLLVVAFACGVGVGLVL